MSRSKADAPLHHSLDVLGSPSRHAKEGGLAACQSFGIVAAITDAHGNVLWREHFVSVPAVRCPSLQRVSVIYCQSALQAPVVPQVGLSYIAEQTAWSVPTGSCRLATQCKKCLGILVQLSMRAYFAPKFLAMTWGEQQ